MKHYIDKIVEDGDNKDMECLSKMLVDALHDIKDYDYDKFKNYEMDLYVLAYGETLTDEVKEEWVEEMNPEAKWTFDEVKSVITSKNINIPVSSAYVIMNMLYSDLSSALGSGDDEDSLNRYLRATQDWYYDSDATNSKEEKLFNYYYHIVK